LCARAGAAILSQATWTVRDVVSGHSKALTLDPHSSDHTSTCTVTDTTGNDRAVTLSLCLPIDAAGGTWCDDPQTSRKIEPGQTYSNCSENAGGVNNQASLYPLCVVAHGDKAVVLACPPDVPRMVRFVYDAKTKELRAEFDFGLSPVPQQFPSRADAKIIEYQVDAKWAFRRALERY